MKNITQDEAQYTAVLAKSARTAPRLYVIHKKTGTKFHVEDTRSYDSTSTSAANAAAVVAAIAGAGGAMLENPIAKTVGVGLMLLAGATIAVQSIAREPKINSHREAINRGSLLSAMVPDPLTILEIEDANGDKIDTETIDLRALETE